MNKVRRFATALDDAGLRREDRILLVMQDCIDWPVAFLGALYAGVIPVAVNTLLPASDYAYMISPILPILAVSNTLTRSWLRRQASACRRAACMKKAAVPTS